MKEIKEFCNEIKAVKYFSNDEAALKKLGIEYEMFGTWDAAWETAWDVAQGPAWKDAWDATRNASRDAAWVAAWNAARDAACWRVAQGAARNAAWGVAQDAAWGVAWGAALQCCMTTVCKDLDIPQEHRDYASQEWEIWKAGYGVLGKVENVFYLYEKP